MTPARVSELLQRRGRLMTARQISVVPNRATGIPAVTPIDKSVYGTEARLHDTDIPESAVEKGDRLLWVAAIDVLGVPLSIDRTWMIVDDGQEFQVAEMGRVKPGTVVLIYALLLRS